MTQCRPAIPFAVAKAVHRSGRVLMKSLQSHLEIVFVGPSYVLFTEVQSVGVYSVRRETGVNTWPE